MAGRQISAKLKKKYSQLVYPSGTNNRQSCSGCSKNFNIPPKEIWCSSGPCTRKIAGIEVAVILVGNNSKMGLNETERSHLGKQAVLKDFMKKLISDYPG